MLVGLAFCFASSVTFPALLLALWWREFNTMGAVIGMSAGLISSTVLIILSNPVWPGETSPLGSLALDNPAIFCIPIGFLGLLPGHEAVVGARQRAPVRGALRALGDRARAPRRPATAHAPKPAADRKPEPTPEPVG